MKKFALLILVVVIAALSVMAATAAPRDRYYDQMGNKHWCNSDSYGCWVTGENGEKVYIMFWSEAARDYIMGKGSNAPIGTNPGTSELGLMAPMPVKSSESGGGGSSGGGGTSPCKLTPEQCEKQPENQGKTCVIKNPDVATCTCDCS